MNRSLKIAHIFGKHWTDFQAKMLPKYAPERRNSIKQEVEKMLQCASGTLGWAEYICENCVETYRVNFSCKGKFCTRCGKKYTDDWINRMKAHLLQVEHRHVVFTIPEILRHHLWSSHESVLKIMMDKAVETLKELMRKFGGLEVGIISAIHTFGRDLKYNPHVHMLLTSGGLSDKKVWTKLPFIPYAILRKKWQYLFLTEFRKLCKNDSAINLVINECFEKYPDGFYIRIEKPMKNANQVARYVGRYLGRPAMAEGKLLDYDGKTVKFWYIDHETKKRVELRLEVHEWMKRLVNHIVKSNFKKVRHYGIYSRRSKEIARKILKQSNRFKQHSLHFVEKSRKSFKNGYIGGFESRGENCRHCGQKTVLYKIWHPKHGVVYEYKEKLEEVNIENSPSASKKESGWNQLSLPQLQERRTNSSGRCVTF